MIQFQYRLFADSDDFPIHLQYGYHDKSLYVHSHEDFCELVIVLDGSADHIVNGKSYGIALGDVFVINQFTEHGFFQPDKLKICNIMFKPEQVFDDTYDMKQLAGFQALFVLEPHYSQNHSFCAQLKLTADEFRTTEAIVTEIMEEYLNQRCGWKDLVLSGFRRLCVILSRFYRTDKVKYNNEVLKLADTVAYIENHFSSHLTLAALAQISGYSDRQLMRIFKAAFSVTPNEYIADLRMKKAKQLLESTNLSIGEISWICGFDDQNYFSRFFKRNTGMTPTEYRAIFQK